MTTSQGYCLALTGRSQPTSTIRNGLSGSGARTACSSSIPRTSCSPPTTATRWATSTSGGIPGKSCTPRSVGSPGSNRRDDTRDCQPTTVDHTGSIDSTAEGRLTDLGYMWDSGAHSHPAGRGTQLIWTLEKLRGPGREPSAGPGTLVLGLYHIYLKTTNIVSPSSSDLLGNR